MQQLNMNDDRMNYIRNNLPELDMLLGSGSMIPFNNTDSGARKILAGTQKEHVIPIEDGETAFIQTGTEQQYGEFSSSIIKAKSNLTLIAKVSKFSALPNHHYFAVFVNEDDKTIEMIERRSYKYISETYGFFLNNDYLDSLQIGDFIKKGTILQKSTSYDDYNNRKDTKNPLTAYMSLGQGIEDGIIVSRSFANSIRTPLFHAVPIIANGNDIPLNLLGKDDTYKSIPNIGEEVTDGILLALRKENKDNALFSQDWNRLKDIMMSDDKFTVSGTLVDADIHCNDPEGMRNNPYYQQFTEFWDDSLLFARNFCEVVAGLVSTGYKESYDVEKLHSICKRKIGGTQFIRDKVFSNLAVDLMIVEMNTLSVGDKMSNRHGGKGVVVAIWDDEIMPMLETGQRLELIYNSSTCVNRLNAGQMFEVEINHRAQRILEFMRLGILTDKECADMYTDFMSIGNEKVADYIKNYLGLLDENSLHQYIDIVKSGKGIHQTLRPISDSFDLDKLAKMDEVFPWAATKYRVWTFLPDSNGNPRMVESLNQIICGTEAVSRLKQYAEEKFSVTSLSATNIRRENTRSKANKMYKGIYTKTPIKFGDMEMGNVGNIGVDIVIAMLMIYSLSPDSRLISGEQQLTGDPYNIDIKLDRESTNIKVEIINTKLKTVGLRLVFKKIPKKRKIGFSRLGFVVDNEPKPELRYGFKVYDSNCNAQDTMIAYWNLTHNQDGTVKRMNGLKRIGFTAQDESAFRTSQIFKDIFKDYVTYPPTVIEVKGENDEL